MPKKKEIQKLTLTEWCDKQVAENHELALCWDGGGDSGWMCFELDGEEIHNDFTETLLDHLDNELNYGSWAGEFGANGKAFYDSTQKAFIGTDYYHETDADTYEANILIRIPKDLWFNRLEIHIEANRDESANADIDFVIQNGFKLDEHVKIEEELGEYLEENIESAVKDFVDNTGKEFNSIWDDISIEFSEGVVNGKHREFNLKELDIRYDNTSEKEIYLDITEITMPENEKEEN